MAGETPDPPPPPAEVPPAPVPRRLRWRRLRAFLLFLVFLALVAFWQLPAMSARALADEAHSVKGSAGTVGARHLQGLCRRLEILGKEDRAGEAQPWLAAAEAEFARAAAVLESELKAS